MGRQDALPAYRAAPTSRSDALMPQLAQVGGFHLVWRDGAFVPVGLANAPRDPQSRAIWVQNAARVWLHGTAEGRRLVTQMRVVPTAVDIEVRPDGSWSVGPGRAGQPDTTTFATLAAVNAWFSTTPQGRRAFRRLRERARRTSPPSAPPAAATTPTTATPTAPPPAVTTAQPQPATTTTTGSEPAPSGP